MRGFRLVIAILLIALAAGTVSADDEFTVQINGVDYRELNDPTFTWGDKIDFTGTDNVSGKVLISLGEPGDEIDWVEPTACKELAWNVRGATFYPNDVKSDKSWSYTWDSGKSKCNYPNIDTELNIEVYSGGMSAVPISFPISMQAVVTETPTETPDLLSTLSTLEGEVEAQGSQIDAQGTQIGEQGGQIEAHETTLKTHETQIVVQGTQVSNHSVDIAALEAQLAQLEAQQQQQQSLIDQIWAFLFGG